MWACVRAKNTYTRKLKKCSQNILYMKVIIWELIYVFFLYKKKYFLIAHFTIENYENTKKISLIYFKKLTIEKMLIIDKLSIYLI